MCHKPDGNIQEAKENKNGTERVERKKKTWKVYWIHVSRVCLVFDLHSSSFGSAKGSMRMWTLKSMLSKCLFSTMYKLKPLAPPNQKNHNNNEQNHNQNVWEERNVGIPSTQTARINQFLFHDIIDFLVLECGAFGMWRRLRWWCVQVNMCACIFVCCGPPRVTKLL